MNIISLQSNFVLGEIDERLHSRVDLNILTKGVKRARNVCVLPQGGLRRRFGTKYIDGLTLTATTGGCKIVEFEFMDETKYVLLFENVSLKIYHNDALVATLGSPYTAAQLPLIKYTQSHNVFISVHPDVAPYVLRRVSAHASWTYTAPTFSYVPTNDFDQNYDGVTFTPSALRGTAVTITCSGAGIIKSTHVGGLFIGDEGTLRIDSVNTGANTITGFVIDAFKGDDIPPYPPPLPQPAPIIIPGKMCLLTEPAWTAALGYPRCATFFQGRLCLGGTRTLPHGVWLSTTNDFFDFNDSESLPTSSIGIYINTNNANIIENIIGEKSFIIFTSSGMVATQVLNDAPLTQLNASFNLQNKNGIGTVNPVLFDNKILYVDRGGKIIWGVSYDVQKGGHISKDASILAQSLLDNPVEMGEYRNTEVDNGNYLFLINTDGTLVCLQSIEDQEVSGWTLCTTDGYFRHIASSENDVYFIVERTINTVKKFYLEKLDFDLTLDCVYDHTYGSPTTSITGLSYLEGKTVKILGDDKLQADKVVTSGAITLSTAATHVILGINYVPEVVPLPVNVATQTGNDLYLSKHVKTMWIDYFESLGIYVDNVLIPFLRLDTSLFDTAPPLKTGFYVYTPTKGWEPNAEISITQNDPYPMTLRGIGRQMQLENI